MYSHQPRLNSNMPEIPASVKFDEVGYVPNSFDNINEMLKSCAESIASDSALHIVRITYGSYYSAIVTTYTDANYRSIFAIGYPLTQPIYLRKSEGVWDD